MPPRIQRFRLRLMRFNPDVIHVSGKQQLTADALSRAPASFPSDEDISLVNDAAVMARQTLDALPATSRKLQEIVTQQKSDPETREVRDFCQRGWPAFMPQNPLLHQYWTNQRYLTIVDDVLLFNDRIVIPTNMRLEMLNRLHESHLGVTKCRALAQTSVWWPNISSQIEDMVRKCSVCAKLRPTTKEPHLPSSFPEHPWSRVAMDLFDLHGKTYLLLVDYHSRWPKIRLLDRLTSTAIIVRLKSIFATHGIPDVVVSDNGPQFASVEFKKFTEEFCFTHTTSSPRYPQANGEAERAVQTVKNLLRKSTDPYVALLLYRATPLQNGFAPSELLMGRTLKTKLPPLKKTQTSNSHLPLLFQKEQRYRDNQQDNFNRRHAVQQAPELKPGDSVYIKDLHRSGSIISRHPNPRSYIVDTEQGTIRRNRAHLVATPSSPVQSAPVTNVPETPPAAPRSALPAESETNTSVQPEMRPTPHPPAQHQVTRSGRTVIPPKRLDI